jgi:hypothetical protein
VNGGPGGTYTASVASERALPDFIGPLPPLQREVGLRDAERISDRIARDEAAADAAREAYRSEGLPVLEDLAGDLEPGERLHAVHRMAMLELRSSELPLGGTLLVTSRRLIHRGAELLAWPLGDIEEMSVALERLVLVELANGTDLAIEVDTPRLFRVQLAAAIAALREAGGLEAET